MGLFNYGRGILKSIFPSKYEGSIKTYDQLKGRLEKNIYNLQKLTVNKTVDINSYRRQQNTAMTHYGDLIDTVEQLKDRYAKEKYSEKKEKIEKDLKYMVTSLNKLHGSYSKFLDDAKKRGVKLGISELRAEEKEIAKESADLEGMIGKIAAVFLLVAASGSFGYALTKALFGNMLDVTGGAVGVVLNNNPSLFLSTLALIIVIFLVSPSDISRT